MVFIWFLLLSIPAALVMNRIGRKKTVLLSLVITFALCFSRFSETATC